MSNIVVSSGQIIVLPPLLGENFSYDLAFEGPRLQCTNTTLVEMLEYPHVGRGNSIFLVFNGTWSSSWSGVSNRDDSIFTLTKTESQGYFYDESKGPSVHCDECDPYYPECYFGNLNRTTTVVIQRQVMRCHAQTATYHVSIRYVRGIQKISYFLEHGERLDLLSKQEYIYNKTEYAEGASETEGYKSLAAVLLPWYQKLSSRALLDSIDNFLAYQYHESWSIGADTPSAPYQFPNGSEIQLIKIETMPMDKPKNEFTRLEDSVLNRNRFQTFFDPRGDLNLTEASLNDILANITISALSLNTWYDNVTVQETQYENVYRFSDPLNFFLPYGLCLGLTLVFVGLGLYALHQNGTPATDGGFLQLMMTTRGDTTMSQEVKEGSIGGRENAPRALLDIRVRFGELTTGSETSSVKLYGFGTMDETISLRRRRQDALHEE
ncbi:hypothetical protein OPT61_g4949 [Boeremia exigua]|uniref:Uncharacterized protein n=1 Tax=Boeremia exigua TaxID=749465 RepID=A0ACC2IC88_9PLEO|nr:hypothetical protein OPT61_g4949 [Boeremia exigua]